MEDVLESSSSRNRLIVSELVSDISSMVCFAVVSSSETVLFVSTEVARRATRSSHSAWIEAHALDAAACCSFTVASSA